MELTAFFHPYSLPLFMAKTHTHTHPHFATWPMMRANISLEKLHEVATWVLFKRIDFTILHT